MNFVKFSPNICANFFAERSYESLSIHVFFGSNTSEGTSGHSVGTSRLKVSSCLNFIKSNFQVKAAVTIARLYFMLILFPTPYGPPDHPVLIR